MTTAIVVETNSNLNRHIYEVLVRPKIARLNHISSPQWVYMSNHSNAHLGNAIYTRQAVNAFIKAQEYVSTP